MKVEEAFEAALRGSSMLEDLGRTSEARAQLAEAMCMAHRAGNQSYSVLLEVRLALLDDDIDKAIRIAEDARKARESGALDNAWVNRVWDAIVLSWGQGERDRRLRTDAWRRLSARAAHRIDNQLFVSQGALRALRDAQDPKVAEAVADLEASRETIHRIIREFQRFSKSEPPELTPTQLGPLVNEAVRRIGQMVSQVQVSAEVEEPLPACPLDARQFGEALGELLENALHHTPPGGHVRVTAKAMPSPDGPRVSVAVEDTGSGVAAADKERIFEPFFSRRPGGTGLGLAIVKQIVENHHGTIRETGQEGSGARFEIELPAHAQEETPDESPGN